MNLHLFLLFYALYVYITVKVQDYKLITVHLFLPLHLTDISTMNSMSVWTPVLYVLGTLTFLLLVMMLLHHER